VDESHHQSGTALSDHLAEHPEREGLGPRMLLPEEVFALYVSLDPPRDGGRTVTALAVMANVIARCQCHGTFWRGGSGPLATLATSMETTTSMRSRGFGFPRGLLRGWS
jgi:hypothetical protein